MMDINELCFYELEETSYDSQEFLLILKPSHLNVVIKLLIPLSSMALLWNFAYHDLFLFWLTKMQE
jgi:uncharacterized membrane protein